MNEKIIYIGLDVDDQSFHCTAFLKETGEVIETKTKPTFKGLQNKLEEFKIKFPDYYLMAVFQSYSLSH